MAFVCGTRVLGYRVHMVLGWLYWEVQIGTLVVQVRRFRPDWQSMGVRLNAPFLRVWRDPFGKA